MNRDLAEAFSGLTTPLVADACLRCGVPLRIAPAGAMPVRTGARIAGRALPARHAGSVDVFLEAFESAGAGDVLVIDNGGRLDEGCIGDLTVLEARAAGLSGIFVWGAHRDGPELAAIGFPVWSYGRFPGGPTRLDPRAEDALASARVGSFSVERADVVFADDDGVLFAPEAEAEAILAAATEIHRRERAQADAIVRGRPLREQLRFGEFLSRRAADPSRTFRQHLKEVGGAIEE